MNKTIIVLGLAFGLAGCSKKRVAECDAFVATVEKMASCDKVPEKERGQIKDAAKTIKDALQMLDDAGGVGRAPADVVNSLRETCKSQNESVVETYKKLVPDCFK